MERNRRWWRSFRLMDLLNLLINWYLDQDAKLLLHCRYQKENQLYLYYYLMFDSKVQYNKENAIVLGQEKSFLSLFSCLLSSGLPYTSNISSIYMHTSYSSMAATKRLHDQGEKLLKSSHTMKNKRNTIGTWRWTGTYLNVTKSQTGQYKSPFFNVGRRSRFNLAKISSEFSP